MKRLLPVVAALWLAVAAVPALAGNTTAIASGGHYICITLDGSTDWDGKVDGRMPNGRGLAAIKFFPSAQNDVLVVREGSATGPEILHSKDTGGGGLVDASFQGVTACPYIKWSNQTITTPANARIILIFK